MFRAFIAGRLESECAHEWCQNSAPPTEQRRDVSSLLPSAS